MELYKVTWRNVKRFYESKRSFDLNWSRNERRSQFYTVTAYKLNCKTEKWEIIRKLEPTKGN